MTRDPLRLMIYDRTCRGRGPLLGLSHAWGAGGLLYRGLRRIDHTIGVTSWEQALRWLVEIEPERSIEQIQFWGHGRWGRVLVNGESLDRDVLEGGHHHFEALEAIRSRLVGPEALWWFRTCETFGALEGQRFASAWTRFFGCRAAGHTFVIALWQSGLHSLAPGQEPHWDVAEGLARGSGEEPLEALWSSRTQPNTVSFLHNEVPADF